MFGGHVYLLGCVDCACGLWCCNLTFAQDIVLLKEGYNSMVLLTKVYTNASEMIRVHSPLNWCNIPVAPEVRKTAWTQGWRWLNNFSIALRSSGVLFLSITPLMLAGPQDSLCLSLSLPPSYFLRFSSLHHSLTSTHKPKAGLVFRST